MTNRAWIEIIPDDEAEGMLRELYDQERDRRTGQVDNIMAIHSLNPATLRAHADLYHTVMHGKSGLSLAEREMIGVVVSSINKCHYWVVHHSTGLGRLTRNSELAGQLIDNFRTASIDERQLEMLCYAEKLTLEPWNMVEEDVIRLRTVSFSDRDILDINQVTSYYAYVNRTADGLGVGLEAWEAAASRFGS